MYRCSFKIVLCFVNFFVSPFIILEKCSPRLFLKKMSIKLIVQIRNVNNNIKHG